MEMAQLLFNKVELALPLGSISTLTNKGDLALLLSSISTLLQIKGKFALPLRTKSTLCYGNGSTIV